MAMSDDLDDVDDGADGNASSDMSTAVLVITFLSLCIAIWVIGSVGAERYGLEYMGIAAIAPRVGGESGKVMAIVTPSDAAAENDPSKAIDPAIFPEYLRGSSYVMVNLGQDQGMRVGDRLQVSAVYGDGNAAEYQCDVFIVGPNFCHAVSSTRIQKLDDGTYSGWGVKRIASGIEENVVSRIFPNAP